MKKVLLGSGVALLLVALLAVTNSNYYGYIVAKSVVADNLYTQDELDSLANHIAQLKLDSSTGWGSYNGDNYTSGAPLVVAAGDTTILYINNSSVNETQLPLGAPSFYSPTDSAIMVENAGDALTARVSFQASSTSNNARAFMLFDIGTTTPIVVAYRNLNLSRGVGITQPNSSTTALFSGATFFGGYFFSEWVQDKNMVR